MKRDQRITEFSARLWQWFDVHKRTLPWRDLQIADDTQRAYMILVSEVMLQQTQVQRVEIIFKRFLEQFPTVQDLAVASNKEVIIAWRGMGYNSRALRLRDAAKTIVDQHAGHFPSDFDQLIVIKGIGAYTAAAIRNFAFHLPTPCIDTNIRRIVHRVFVGPEMVDEDGKEKWEKNDRELLPVAEEVLRIALDSPHPQPLPRGGGVPEGRGGGRAADWHAALMDFGSAVCKKSSPQCELCPMRDGICQSAFKVKAVLKKRKKKESTEPGRLIGSVFVPNRIFRGRIIEQLRDHHEGLSLEELGSLIAIDWNAKEHEEWITGLLGALKREGFLTVKRKKFLLT